MRVGPYCRSCGAEITWAITAPAGKKVPLDRVSLMDGNLIATGETRDGMLEVRGMDRAEQQTLGGQPGGGMRKRYVAHFTTCPNASEHRRR